MEVEQPTSFTPPEVRPGPPERERYRAPRFSRPVRILITIGIWVIPGLLMVQALGQVLFDPPDVAGWEAGQSWFSTGAMLSRMNYASALAGNQKFELARAAREKLGGDALGDFVGAHTAYLERIDWRPR